MENEELRLLRDNLAIAVGRINGVHAAVLTIARHLPQNVAANAHAQLVASSEAVIADALATPTPNLILAEMERVLGEVADVLSFAAQNR